MRPNDGILDPAEGLESDVPETLVLLLMSLEPYVVETCGSKSASGGAADWPDLYCVQEALRDAVLDD